MGNHCSSAADQGGVIPEAEGDAYLPLARDLLRAVSVAVPPCDAAIPLSLALKPSFTRGSTK